ncbi:hypothetical protein [Alteraurantiacibacter palmitatis]|uniref:Uncharacterized protein n=1 Tax=Alteraurantiacibacter palmitatis TaxID=2054628 RepID=A0ABV7EAW9_9SPHN
MHRARNLPCSRRSLLAMAGLAAVALPVLASGRAWARAGLGLPPVPASQPVGFAAAAPVVAFLGDQPLIDPSGSLPAWQPPAGYRVPAGAAAMVDEETVRNFDPFF